MLFAAPVWSDEQPALPDLTGLSLEQLAETEVTSTAHFAQQLVDAPSAVSVVTAEDIRRFGYRTLAEILNSMRGIHITHDRSYHYLGARGYGAPGEYAGRIMIMIDGYAAADNYYHQIFIGDEGYLDTALIERVEYAPGPGSAIYGNNAFLGVINVVTRKGRDFDGLESELTIGSHHDRQGRATWGKRFENGAEWLVSASRHTNDGIHRYFDGSTAENTGSYNQRLLLKGNYRGWSLLAARADRHHDNSYAFNAGDYREWDSNSFLNLGYETDLGLNWRSSSRLYYGNYQYNYRGWDNDGFVDTDHTEGLWYGLDSKLIYLGFERQRILVGGEYHVDDRQHTDYQAYYADMPLYGVDSGTHGTTASLYAEDMITFTSWLGANIGGRIDSREYPLYGETQRTFNPRLALIYTPTPETSLKLSYGQAHRFAPVYEIYTDLPNPSRIRTLELVAEHKTDNRRLLGTLYRYRVDRLANSEWTGIEYRDIQGMELESEWQWPGGSTLKLSYALQRAEDNLGDEPANIPRSIGKLQLSQPLLGDKLRASLELRRTGRHLNTALSRIDSYTLTDLTLTSAQWLPSTEITLALRNLFDVDYTHATNSWDSDSGEQPQDGRNLWLSLRYRFQ